MSLDTITASELYAMSEGIELVGPDRCHWCGSCCERNIPHNDPPPIIGLKRSAYAKRPGNSYICLGCYLWQRPKVTLRHLGGRQQDGQSPKNHSWWITPNDSRIITEEDFQNLWKLLLQPPLVFSLSLLDGDKTNHIQLDLVNNLNEIKGYTKLSYTLNNIPHTYTVFELEDTLRNYQNLEGLNGREPGVQALIRLLGHYHLPEKEKQVGRPKQVVDDRPQNKVVTKSERPIEKPKKTKVSE